MASPPKPSGTSWFRRRIWRGRGCSLLCLFLFICACLPSFLRSRAAVGVDKVLFENACGLLIWPESRTMTVERAWRLTLVLIIALGSRPIACGTDVTYCLWCTVWSISSLALVLCLFAAFALPTSTRVAPARRRLYVTTCASARRRAASRRRQKESRLPIQMTCLACRADGCRA